MGGHVYVDETKARDYLLVAVAIAGNDVSAARRVVRSLHMPGQNRLHMSKERPSRRRQIITAMAAMPISVTVYRAGRDHKTDLKRRAVCLRNLVADVGHSLPVRLCLERDDSLVALDRQEIIETVRATKIKGDFEYWHEAAASEAMLAVPDAFAWAWAKGGEWQQACQEADVKVVDL